MARTVLKALTLHDTVTLARGWHTAFVMLVLKHVLRVLCLVCSCMFMTSKHDACMSASIRASVTHARVLRLQSMLTHERVCLQVHRVEAPEAA